MFLLAMFFLAYLVQPLGGGLHDMEPVDGYLGIILVLWVESMAIEVCDIKVLVIEK